MQKFDIFGKNRKIYYIKAQVYCFATFLTITIILFIASIFNIAIISLSVISSIISVLFLYTYLINKEKYGRKIAINDDFIAIYDYKDRLIRELELKEINHCCQNVAFTIRRTN